MNFTLLVIDVWFQVRQLKLRQFTDYGMRLNRFNECEVSSDKLIYMFVVQQLHRDLPNTTLYAYGPSAETASYPGPTLESLQNVATHIRWENHILDPYHMFTVDPTVTWANPILGGVPIVVHNHGAETAGIWDGYPDAWFTASGEHGDAYPTQNYTYPNQQQPTLLWYYSRAPFSHWNFKAVAQYTLHNILDLRGRGPLAFYD